VDATQVGGAIQKIRFLAIRVKEGWASYWNWPEFEKDLFPTGSMPNLLTPPELVSRHDYATSLWTEHIPDARVHPMPNRPQSLCLVAAQYSDPEKLILEGIHILKVHHQNYTAKVPEPKALQLLWWESPKEHWDRLQEGSKMNFLKTPPAGLQPNTPMDDEQQAVAGSFVDELIDLGITGLAPGGRSTLLNAPLFVVAKEGQPGEWCVITDML
jgi:hypothetical protein